jgi:hypothetical protein
VALSHLCGFMNRGSDTRVGSAATDISAHATVDISIGWSAVLIQQRDG